MSRGVRRRWQLGVGLMEIAVALLVLSISALGLARGQLAARQVSLEAMQRIEALHLAGGLLELHASGGGHPDFYFAELAQLVEPGVDCSRQACSEAQWAAWNLWLWRSEVEGDVAAAAGASGVPRLISPEACLLSEHGLAQLALTWRQSPVGHTPGCGETDIPGGVRSVVLRTWSRREGL